MKTVDLEGYFLTMIYTNRSKKNQYYLHSAMPFKLVYLVSIYTFPGLTVIVYLSIMVELQPDNLKSKLNPLFYHFSIAFIFSIIGLGIGSKP